MSDKIKMERSVKMRSIYLPIILCNDQNLAQGQFLNGVKLV